MRIPVLVLAALATGCTSHTAASSENDPFPQAVTSRVESVPASEINLRDYCSERPTEAANDSIVVHPGEVSLRIGEVLSPAALTTLSSRSGARIPVHVAVDSPHLERGPRDFEAISAGSAQLRVRPLCSVVLGEGDIPVTMVPITVHP